MIRLEAIGNLGGDAIEKNINGQQYITFSVAVTERYKKADGTSVDRVTWLSCIRRGTGGILPYLRKGTKVFIRGTFKTSTYDYKGQFAVNIDVTVQEIELLSSNRDTQAPPPPEEIPATHANQSPY